MKVLVQVCLVAVIALMTSVASAEIVRVNYDYAAMGPGIGAGLWSVTIDSGLIYNVEEGAYEDAGDAVTFMAPMAIPVFKQRDALLPGDVVPSTPGLVGWTNNAETKGAETGMEWKFYEAGDIVTLYAVTGGYRDYTWDIVTTLACPDKTRDDLSNWYYWRVALADNPDGLDLISNDNDERGRLQTVSWWGDVDVFEGHRHSGSRFQNDDRPGVGLDSYIDVQDGALDEMVDGDGIGVSLGIREIDDDDQQGDASLFFSNVMFGGDVFADTDAIPEPATIALLGLGFVALRRRKRA